MLGFVRVFSGAVQSRQGPAKVRQTGNDEATRLDDGVRASRNWGFS